MSHDQAFGQFGNRFQNNFAGYAELGGFVTNPLAASVTPVQEMMYQAAYLQAKKELQEPEWPMAECWN